MTMDKLHYSQRPETLARWRREFEQCETEAEYINLQRRWAEETALAEAEEEAQMIVKAEASPHCRRAYAYADGAAVRHRRCGGRRCRRRAA